MEFYNECAVCIERVDARRAAQYLSTNVGNRKMRPERVAQFENDMRNGDWTECVDPIVFYDDGVLASGQHRLQAIVNCGLMQTFFVARGLSRRAGLNVDKQQPRSLVDSAVISGVDPSLSNMLLGVARAIEMGMPTDSNRSLSSSERLQFVGKHRQAAEWAIKHGPVGRGVRTTVTLGAVGRAYYHESDKAKLMRFCEVMSSGGVPNGQSESAALSIREHVRSRPSHQKYWRDSFLKVQNAIRYFMQGKPLTVIKGIATETYPLR